jgi:TonB family protein
MAEIMRSTALAFAEPTVVCLDGRAAAGVDRVEGEVKRSQVRSLLSNRLPSHYRPVLWPGRLIATAVSVAILLGIVAIAIHSWTGPTTSYPPDDTIVVTLLPNSVDRSTARPDREMSVVATPLPKTVEISLPAAEPQAQRPIEVSEPLRVQVLPPDSAEPDPLGAVTHYQRAVLARISAQRRYPRGALLAGFEGNGTIRFTIERIGRLAEVSIIASTGSKALDRATLDMVHRSAPFPPIPPSFRISSK